MQLHQLSDNFRQIRIVGLSILLYLYLLFYPQLHRCPLAVHEYLNQSIMEGDAQRARSFHTQPQIKPQKFAFTDNQFRISGAYRHFQLNRGHMAGAANYSGNQQLKNSSFSMANVVPQHYSNNSGIWYTFQRYCRSLVKEKKCDTLEIISGPIFNSGKKLEGYEHIYINQQKVLMKNGAVVPPRLYKIIKCNTKDKAYASGFTFYNETTEDNQKNLSQFEEPLEDIEDATGLVFNFKEKLDGNLGQYDSEGLNKSKYLLDSTYYMQKFNSAKTIDDMNQALRRAQEQKIYFNELKEKASQKIEFQALSEIKQIKTKNQASSCSKLSDYLKLHKNLFFLGNKDKFTTAKQELEQQIRNQIPICRNTATPEQQKTISWRASYQTKRYQCPAYDLLSQLFPNPNQRPQNLSRTASTISTVSNASEIQQTKVSEQKN